MQRVCRSCASECGARSVSPRDGGHRRSADLLRLSAKELFRGSARVPAPLILGWARALSDALGVVFAALEASAGS